MRIVSGCPLSGSTRLVVTTFVSLWFGGQISPGLALASAHVHASNRFGGPTLMVTCAVASPPKPSRIVYRNVSVPWKPAFAVYVIVPLALTVAVPLAGVVAPATEIT